MADQIRQLEERIAGLEKQLETAMATGDEATKELRDQMTSLMQEFEEFKIKARNKLEETEVDWESRNRRELGALMDKYEAMLDDLRKGATNAQEMLQMELKKRIAELEQQILDLRSEQAKALDNMRQEQ